MGIKNGKPVTALWSGLWLLLGVWLTGVVPSMAEDDIPGALDGWMRQHYRTNAPGAAVIVTKNDKVIFENAYGMADLEHALPLKTDMVFRLASITKQFTAAAILMLEQDGKLTVNDPITKYLPDYPTQGHTITIHHLLTHTSGIKNYTNILGLMATRIRLRVTPEGLINSFKDEPMDFPPGDQWRYSNSGYVLLGTIIEKVTGKSYGDFIETRIFKPLGMTASYYGDEEEIVPRRARGYTGSADRLKNAKFLSMSQPYAAGALLSTVGDMAKWMKALTSGKVISPQSFDRMTTPVTLNNGEAFPYGYGLLLTKIRGHDTFGHNGGIFGFSTNLFFIPDETLFVCILNNTDRPPVRPEFATRHLAAIALGNPYMKRVIVDVDQDILRRYVGTYRFEGDIARAISLRLGHLYAQRGRGRVTKLLPTSPTTFVYENSFAHATFVIGDDGAISMHFYPDEEGSPVQIGRKVGNASPGTGLPHADGHETTTSEGMCRSPTVDGCL